MKRALPVLLFALLVITGCGRPARPHVVALDLVHGAGWPAMREDLERMGFRVVEFRSHTDFRGRQQVGVLAVVLGEPGPTVPISERTVAVLDRFVRAGGGLLCAGEAWSWVADGESERSPDEFPLNVLGRRLGFVVLDRTTREPRNLSPALMGGLDGIKRSDWWASEVRVTAETGEALITDESLRPMAVRLRHGDGRVVVVGHRDLLRENPDALRNILLYLSGLDEHLL